MEMAAPVGGGGAPKIVAKGPTAAPPVGAAPPPVRPTTPGGKVAASRSATPGVGMSPLINESPIRLSQVAQKAAAGIYKPIMDNYNSQMQLANGLAQKRTADVAAFGQWYGQQQNALMAQETARQTQLQGLIGQLGSDTSTTPTNGVQSSIGTNMAAPTGGAQQLAASGDNAAQSGILSSSALSNASNTNDSQNLLSALGGSNQQNMMAIISGDLTKSQTSIEDAASKAYTEEGSTAAKLDSNMTSYLNDQNKNILGQNKNLIQGAYDQGNINNKTLGELTALAKSLPSVPPALAQRIAQLSGGYPGTGLTAAGQRNQIEQQNYLQRNAIEAQKNNLTAYENVTRRLAVDATNAKTKDMFVIDSIKNSIAQSEAGAKVTVSSAEAKYYAARTGLSVAQSKADLTKAYAYARYESARAGQISASGAGTPLTSNELDTQMKAVDTYALELSAGLQKGVIPKDVQGARAWMNASGYKSNPLAMAAFDRQFFGAITPNTAQALINQEHWTPTAVRSAFGAPRALPKPKSKVK